MKLINVTEQQKLTPYDTSLLFGWVIGEWEQDSFGFINVYGNVRMEHKNLSKIPIKFGFVTGDFYCHDNHLTSLSGAPREVGGSFFCARNQLTSLKYAPKEVGGNFFCFKNKISSLEYAPTSVGGDFYCYANKFDEEPDHSMIQLGGNFRWQ